MSSDPPAREPWFTRVYARGEALVAALRRRWRWFDHLVRAGGRYERTQGDLLAAGVTYFAFLGLFPVLLLVASIVGLVLAGDALLQQQLYDAIREAFPGRAGASSWSHELSARGRQRRRHRPDRRWSGFLYAGLRTMDKLRIGMELIWKGRGRQARHPPRQPAGPARAGRPRAASGWSASALTGAVTQATSWVLELLGLADGAATACSPGCSASPWRWSVDVVDLPLAAAGRARRSRTRCGCCCPGRCSGRPGSRCSSCSAATTSR